jgi:hypothetical protein
LFYFGKNVLSDKATMSKNKCQFVAKILYFTFYFRLFKYMVSFSRCFTVCITYQPPLVIYANWAISANNYLGKLFRNLF